MRFFCATRYLCLISQVISSLESLDKKFTRIIISPMRAIHLAHLIVFELIAMYWSQRLHVNTCHRLLPLEHCGRGFESQSRRECALSCLVSFVPCK